MPTNHTMYLTESPFGMVMPGRNWTAGSADGYSFGFNGQLKVNEICNSGNINTAEFWEYDTRISKRWNYDPKPSPSISPFACFANNPIWASDVKGDTLKFATGSSEEFIKATKEKIEKIRSTEEGALMLEKLENSDNIITIKEIKDVKKSSFQEEYDENGNLTGNGTISLGKGTFRADGVKFNSFYALSHELFHSYQLTKSPWEFTALVKTMSKNGKVSLAEVQAVGFENYIRGSLDEEGFNSPRLYYSVGENSYKIVEYTKNRWGNKLWNGSDPWEMEDFLTVRREKWIFNAVLRAVETYYGPGAGSKVKQSDHLESN